MEVLVYASTRDKEVHAKTVEVVVYVSIREINTDAKIVDIIILSTYNLLLDGCHMFKLLPLFITLI